MFQLVVQRWLTCCVSDLQEARKLNQMLATELSLRPAWKKERHVVSPDTTVGK